MPLPAQTSTLRRVIVAVALLGVLVVAHLGLQKANGFVRGCTGFEDVAYSVSALGAAPSGAGSGCATVTEGEYASFAGVSNITWGLLFYVLVVGLRLAYAATGSDRLRLASAGVVGVGLLYTAYLVYLQAAVIGSFCVLCMTSAALVLTLFVLHFVEQRRLRAVPAEGAAPPRRALAGGSPSLQPYIPILGVFALLLAADVVLAGRVQASIPTPTAAPAPNIAAVAAQNRAAAPPPDTGGACSYDPQFAPLTDLSTFTSSPYKGSPDAPVTVVEVFDPNCPHCKALAESMEPVVAEHGDEATFYYVAYPLRQSSLAQTIALKVAAREGRFFELLDEMFARQDATWGMSVPEIVASVNAAGMDGAAFQALLNDEARVQPILAQIEVEAKAVQAAFTAPDGGLSVPKLAINGRVVQSDYASYSPRCLGEFITEAAAGTAAE
ncbi:vitamin K epoxide reductase family protein [Rubrivirga sp. S365]|uniref:Vitamin K epoxide reductase family protein n=1 Tax=Rubrivirga litoralis TaxID=3075598 RepID=A0ABU3BN43_9BACT|nr:MULTISPECIES: vitamin K epoxide reductase family protein [unclassified Rubrivirga]MDT0630722.1 vitamin K epoxide reductase family protein [Rubrivirga sp. F394]MDT7856392.1 vitamin K epoxide reductase family protein [Rubrivirga sp. S365]